MRRAGLAIILAIIAFGGVLHFADTAADDDVAKWFKAQRNDRGDFCCDQSDGRVFEGDYKFNKDGSVTLDNGITLPAYMILRGKNPLRKSIWWWTTKSDGTHVDLCFSPGKPQT